MDGAKAKWRAEAKEVMGSTTASMYATLLVVIYVAFSFTELVRFPANKDYLEIYGFFTFLYFVGTLYVTYILTYIVKNKANSVPRAVENLKSHGSVTVRLGVIIFGTGALIYYLMELLRFAELAGSGQSPCFHPAIGLNDCLAIIFTTLQAIMIFTYPRLNIHAHKLLNRFGTMHLVALNIIMWIRTLIKESIEEIIEFESEHRGEEEGLLSLDGSSCRSLLVLMEEAERHNEVCNEFRHDLLGDAAVAAVPYLYPFMIEFALIGASVALIMSKHIGMPKQDIDTVTFKQMRRPNPSSFWAKADFSQSTKGVVLGCLVFVAAIVNLSTFFGLDGHEHSKDHAELLSKISNTVMNTVGVIACLVGIERIQRLDHKILSKDESFDLDETLLRFGSIFTFLYSTFTIITGSFNGHIEGFPNEVFILNGVMEILQIILQVIFIHNLKEKVLPESLRVEKPGRQVTAFLFLFNVSQWLVYTFEIQKVRASLVEAGFYGFMPWVIIRRVTLPLAVFFRFHSSVVSIELWKEVYYTEEVTDTSEDRSTDRSTSTESPDQKVTMTKLMQIDDNFTKPHDDKIEIDA